MEKALGLCLGMYTVGISIAVAYTAYHIGYYKGESSKK